MHRRWILVVGVIVSWWSFECLALDRVRLELPRYAPDATVAANIRNECEVPEQLMRAVARAGRKSGIAVDTSEPEGRAGELPALRIEIVDALSARTGSPGGHNKFVTVTGQLDEGDTTVARFRAHRRSSGGFGGWMKSACTVFDRIDRALGKDVVDWLGSPVDGAQLGDALDRS